MAQPHSPYGVVLVTVASQTEGEAIAETIITAKLAACVTLIPVQSIYRWQGKIQHDTEYQLIIKTDLALFPALAAKIQELHSYTVPEIIALPIINGFQPYLDWIGENVTSR